MPICKLVFHRSSGSFPPKALSSYLETETPPEGPWHEKWGTLRAPHFMGIHGAGQALAV